MKITCNTQRLAAALRLVCHVAPTKPPIPVLSSVLITATPGNPNQLGSEGSVELYATDFELGFRTRCTATVDEPGVVAVPAKRLLDVVERLSNGDVEFVTDGPYVRIACGTFRSRLNVQPTADFPAAPDVEGVTATLSTQALRTMIARTRYAITDRTKYVVNGALLTLTERLAAMVATDGKRIALTTMPYVGVGMSAIVPTKALDAIAALLDGEHVEFAQGERHLFFSCVDKLLISRRVDGEYPKYERFIPRDHDKRVTLNRAALAAALRRVGLMTEDSNAVYAAFEAGSVTLSASSAEAGDAVERISIDYDGPALKTCVNWQYVLDFLDAATEQNVTLDLKSEVTPILLTDGPEFINVVMTMRVK